MKQVLVAAILLALAGCTSETGFGPCIGAFDDRDPALIYKVSGWNVAMGIVFFELVFPPVIVVADETLCPVGRKPIKAQP